MKNKQAVVLGLNGWFERGHDASACLTIGNKIVAFVEEERFNRKRYSFDSMPTQAIAFCLDKAGVTVDQLDSIAYGWNYPKSYNIRNRPFPSPETISKQLFPENLYGQISVPPIEFIDHHLAHASSSYRVSGFDNTAILVLDGQGEDSSGMLASANNGNIKIIQKIPIAYSLGYMMEAACKFIGLRTSDAGKLMGLAGHGNNSQVFDNILFDDQSYSIRNFPSDSEIIGGDLDEQEKVITLWLEYFKSKYKISVKKVSYLNHQKGTITSELVVTQDLKDFAHSVQLTLQTVIIHLTKLLIEKTGYRNLVIAGGIGLNCTTNGILFSTKTIDNLYIQPAANDAGVSIGAATELSFRKYGHKFSRMDSIYLGPVYTNAEIKAALDGYKITYQKDNDIAKTAAKALTKGKIVAWFQGSMEGGPRALGNRSILANPQIKGMHQSVNLIKSREDWRPLAPSILDEYRPQYFPNGDFSPFMLQNHTVASKYVKSIPAVVHTDDTSRYQSVTKRTNERYYAVIHEFYKLTGVPVLMNTSFNIAGEPIVCTPSQAISSFFSSAIDCLAIGDFWVTKK